MRNSKSFANEYGITQKNVTSNPSIGIGLNPNLNIEDEYIENLLKQIHFLNMEIKLIKEKQKQNKGMGIMGLLNKDQNPVVTHAVTSNAKYTDMKSQLSQMVNTAEVDYFRLDDENFAVKAQRDLAEKQSLKEEEKNIEHKMTVDKVLNENREKMNEQLKKLKQLREDNRRISDNFNRVFQQWQDLTTKTKSKSLIKKVTDNLELQVTTLRQKHAADTDAKLNKNKEKLEKADKEFRSSPEYLKLVEENLELKEKLKVTDKELFDKNYLAKEMEEKKKLALRNKDAEAELKKQAIEEADRMKKKLADKKGQMDVRIKESKAALQSNDDVRLVKGKLMRKEKEISDLKKKTQVSEANYKRLKDDVQKLEGALAGKKSKIQEKKKKINDLTIIKNAEASNLSKAELDFQKNSGDYSNSFSTLTTFRKKLLEKQQLLDYLSAKESYLNKEIDLDSGLKSIKIEQLGTLMHSNSGLNQTITSLMEKWDQIIKFSREPPSSI